MPGYLADNHSLCPTIKEVLQLTREGFVGLDTEPSHVQQAKGVLVDDEQSEIKRHGSNVTKNKPSSNKLLGDWASGPDYLATGALRVAAETRRKRLLRFQDA